jgi:hypothetical protein
MRRGLENLFPLRAYLQRVCFAPIMVSGTVRQLQRKLGTPSMMQVCKQPTASTIEGKCLVRSLPRRLYSYTRLPILQAITRA